MKPKILWALFDGKGEFCGTYETKQEAIDDAWGPRFRPHITVAKYELVKESTKKIQTMDTE